MGSDHSGSNDNGNGDVVVAEPAHGAAGNGGFVTSDANGGVVGLGDANAGVNGGGEFTAEEQPVAVPGLTPNPWLMTRADYPSQADAQWAFEQYGGVRADPALIERLDSDRNGIARDA